MFNPLKYLVPLALLLAGAPPLRAQGTPPGTAGATAPDCYFAGINITATGSYGPAAGLTSGVTTTTANSYDNTITGCVFWHLIYMGTSGASSISIELDGAPQGTTTRSVGAFAALAGVAPGSTNPATGTPGGDIAVFTASPSAFLQVKVGTLNAGAVNFVVLGYRPNILTTAFGFGSQVTAYLASGNPAVPAACDKSASVATTAGNTTRVITAVAGQQIHICGFLLDISATGTVEVTSGTGSTCTTPATLTGAMGLTANSTISHGSGLGQVAVAATAKDVCVAAVTGNATGVIAYTIY